MVELEVVRDVVQGLLDVIRRDSAGESIEVPFEMLDVGVDLDGRIGNDFVIIELGSAAGWNVDLGDADLCEVLLGLVFGCGGSAVLDHGDVDG